MAPPGARPAVARQLFSCSMDPRSWGLIQRQAAPELRDEHNLEWLDNYDTDMLCKLDTISARVPEKGLSREYYNMLHWGYARAFRDSTSAHVTRGFKFVAIAKTVTTGRLVGRAPLSTVEILGRIRMVMQGHLSSTYGRR